MAGTTKHIWLIICGDRRLSTAGNGLHDALDDYLARQGYEVVYMTRVFGPEVKITDSLFRDFWAAEARDAVGIGHCEQAEIVGHLDCGKFLNAELGLGLAADEEAAKHWELGVKSKGIINTLSELPTEYVLQDGDHFATE